LFFRHPESKINFDALDVLHLNNLYVFIYRFVGFWLHLHRAWIYQAGSHRVAVWASRSVAWNHGSR
jgi:hypothetical protein